MMTETQALGVFGHHPESSIDFSIEVEALVGMAYDVCVGIASQWPFWARLARALSHGWKSDWEGQPNLKSILEGLEKPVTVRDHEAILSLRNSKESEQLRIAKEALTRIVQHYEARSELYTNSEDLAANLAAFAERALPILGLRPPDRSNLV